MSQKNKIYRCRGCLETVEHMGDVLEGGWEYVHNSPVLSRFFNGPYSTYIMTCVSPWENQHCDGGYRVGDFKLRSEVYEAIE